MPVPAARALYVHKVSAGGFQWTNASHPEGSVRTHAHAGITLTLVVRGSYQELSKQGRSEVCASGSALLRPAEAIHANRFPSDGIESLVLEFDSARLPGIVDYWTGITGQGRFDSPEIARLSRRLRTESHAPDAAAPLALEAATLELFATLARLNRHEESGKLPPPWLRRVHEALATDTSSTWNLQSLAQLAGVHPVHLARAFRSFYGISPGEWLRERRIQGACQKLKSSPAPLSQIALDAGYSDQSHFSRAFLRRFGLTPGRYRRAR